MPSTISSSSFEWAASGCSPAHRAWPAHGVMPELLRAVLILWAVDARDDCGLPVSDPETGCCPAAHHLRQTSRGPISAARNRNSFPVPRAVPQFWQETSDSRVARVGTGTNAPHILHGSDLVSGIRPQTPPANRGRCLKERQLEHVRFQCVNLLGFWQIFRNEHFVTSACRQTDNTNLTYFCLYVYGDQGW